jgi:histidinol phosphatase-like PHP family hydrolase
MELGRRFEFHTHTFYSDGVLSPAELIRYGVVKDYEVLAITDHVDFSNIEHVITSQKKQINEWDGELKVLQGVELTHPPVKKIAKLASMAKKYGADIVICHGQTPNEPVEEGTNAAAVECDDIDILAHPGPITAYEAELARENDIYLEITSRAGHSRGNENVVKSAKESGAKLLVNTDMHKPEDLINQEQAYCLCLEVGLGKEEAETVVKDNPREFMKRLQ